MKTTREQFEEIWPVPEGVYWRDSKGQYGCDNHTYGDAMDAHNIRLDTFTRCQETTDVYVSLIEEMVAELMIPHDTGFVASDWVNRANKAMGKIE
jgi:hypothetical protein